MKAEGVGALRPLPHLILILVAGGVFGAGLAISGMTDPARVIGFLDVSGKWDPALAFVMAGAVGVYGLGTLALRHLRSANVELPSTGPSRIDRRLVIGAAIFGIGWGLSGFCPGPALANLGALRMEALGFRAGNGDWDGGGPATFRC